MSSTPYPALAPISFTASQSAATRAGLTRRDFMQAASAAAALALAGCQTVPSPEQTARARAIIEKFPTFDMHTHAGRIHVRGNLDDTMQAVAEGGLTGYCFGPVPDRTVVKRVDGNPQEIRKPAPGELYDSTYQQLAKARLHLEKHDMAEFDRPADIRAAKAEGRHGVLIAAEGGDFLEGRLDRVEEAYGRGMRSIQLVHQRVNELGDILNAAPRHGGLTQFGRQVIREMNRLNMIVDGAHLTWEGMRTAVEVTDKPIMFSHAVFGGRVAITTNHARAVAETGGVIGVYPGGTHVLDVYLDRFVHLADLVGVDHVGLGSDIDASQRWRAFDDHSKLPALAAGLLWRGFSEAEVAAILGGNFLRLFAAVSMSDTS